MNCCAAGSRRSMPHGFSSRAEKLTFAVKSNERAHAVLG